MTRALSEGDLPERVGIDARGLQPQRTGLGNYLLNLLLPMLAHHPRTQFFLYSNDPIVAPEHPNVVVRCAPHIKSAVAWLHLHLPGELRSDRIDVFWGAFGYVPVLRRACPAVLTLYDFVHKFAGASMRWRTRWNRRVFQSLSLRRADEVVAISHATAHDAAAVGGRAVDVIVAPIIDAAFGPQARAAVPQVLRRHAITSAYLVCAGTMEPRKNLPTMLRAYMQVRSAGWSLPQLVLVGAKGWLDDELQRLVESAIARGEVRRLGFVPNDELAGLYAGAVALVFPSLYEGFGMPVTEAQLCGAPVLHGTHASMREAGGGLGVVVGNDEAAWVACFERLAVAEVPLSCRLMHDIDNDAESASRTMAALLQRTAVRHRR